MALLVTSNFAYTLTKLSRPIFHWAQPGIGIEALGCNVTVVMAKLHVHYFGTVVLSA